MIDRLLGMPPNQILESEKLKLLQEISDRHIAHLNTAPTQETMVEWFEKLISLHEEEAKIDRLYPGLPD